MALASSPVEGLTEFQYDISRRLFVPEGRGADPHDLGNFVLDTYSAANIQRYEDLDTLLIADAFRFLPESEESLRAMAAEHGIEPLAAATLAELNGQIEEQIRRALAHPDVVRAPEDKKLVTAALVLAQEEFEGKYRNTGRPYFSHLMRVAAMCFYVYERLAEEDFDVDPEQVDAAIVFDLHHDTPELTMPGGKNFDVRREDDLSPLFFYRLMSRLGNQYARDTADGLVHVTHLRKMPWMYEYWDYIDLRVARQWLSAWRKPFDIFDNWQNEPKPGMTDEEDAKRKRKYETAMPKLVEAAPEIAPTLVDVPQVIRSHELLLGEPGKTDGIRPGLQVEKGLRLRAYAAGQVALVS